VLVIPPDQVQSEVSLKDFQEVISAVENKSININDTNCPGLSQLLNKVGFQLFVISISSRGRLPR
jgi:hypothetical protein